MANWVGLNPKPQNITKPNPHIPDAPLLASLKAMHFSGNKQDSQVCLLNLPMPALAWALLPPKYDKLFVPLVLKAPFFPTSSSKPAGFCRQMPQGGSQRRNCQAHPPGHTEQDPRLILQSPHQRGESELWARHPQHTAKPWSKGGPHVAHLIPRG